MTPTRFSALIATHLNLKESHVSNTIRLLEEGATIPFISRYRKEATGSMDETQVAAVSEQLESCKEVEKRRSAIIHSIEEQGHMTPALRDALDQCRSLTELEDIYLPYKPKRKTRASIARERGLEPLAGMLMKQEAGDPASFARRFVKGEIGNVEEALSGARDIMAEWINERTAARNAMRRLFEHEAVIETTVIKGKEDSESKYRDYFQFSEPLRRCPSHRMLAMRRGEEEGVLRLHIAPPETEAITKLEQIFVKGSNAASAQVKLAVKDSYKRLLGPSMETEFRQWSKEKAEDEAIRVFAENLRQLLMAPPLGPKRILAIDPGFRTGCKLVCLDEQGNLLHNETIYPHPPQQEYTRAAAKISTLVQSYKLQVIAIGNGTAGRETEQFIQKHVRLPQGTEAYMVSETGASVYSASRVAREEFPNHDVTVRGAVSIGRRLMDPLSELVKIEPKAIGVGQYQHDVDQKKLRENLDRVVESVVNNVGVNLNTASQHLLRYVSGLGPKLAEQIVTFRSREGAFVSRKDLLKVSGLGPKAFEQAAAFLRIPDGDHPLDRSAVHPERYTIVERMAKDLELPLQALVGNKEVLDSIDIHRYAGEDIGLPTLQDILSELRKPGRDPRGKSKMLEFSKDVRSLEDLKPGMILPGIVTNITRFGVFVDVGVKQDGLVHISQLADRYVSDPTEVVKLHQHVKVKVLEVDAPRKRIAFTMKGI